MNKAAFLIHLSEWNDKRNRIKLDDGVYLYKSEGRKEIKLYEELCYVKGVHDEEPFNFDTFLLVDFDKTEVPYFSLRMLLPDIEIGEFCTIYTLLSRALISFCYSIYSADNFKTSWAYLDYYDDKTMYDYFEKQNRIFDIGKIKPLWKTLKKIRKNKNNNNRLIPAFNAFFASWNSYSLDQMCINLSIVLEALFSPDSHMELSHRIGYNFCHYKSRKREEREELYLLFKKFYSLRSKIVHGSTIDHDILYDIVPRMFKSVCEILEEILLSEKKQKIFTDDKTRKKMFDAWLFG